MAGTVTTGSPVSRSAHRYKDFSYNRNLETSMTNRRQLLKGLCISAIAAPWYMRTSDAAQNEGEVELLFVQTAHSVKLGNGVLKLGGINPATIFFSDRPERVVGHEPTEVFVDHWNVGDNNFAENPPNAALSILSGPEPQEIILVLMNPRLTQDELLYDIKVLEGKQTVSAPSEAWCFLPGASPGRERDRDDLS
jgi:hypothetical protein